MGPRRVARRRRRRAAVDRALGHRGRPRRAGDRGAPRGRRHAGRARGARRPRGRRRRARRGHAAAWRTRACPARRCRSCWSRAACRPPSRSRLAREIGAIIATIGRVAAPDLVAVEPGLPAWIAGLPEFVPVIEHLLSDGDRAAIARFLATPPPADPAPADLLLAHNDLGAEHVLVDPELTGDHRDHRLVRRGTRRSGRRDRPAAARPRPGPPRRRPRRDGRDGAERAGLIARGWCYARCLVLEDLAYAVRRRPDLVAIERASLAALFADV